MTRKPPAMPKAVVASKTQSVKNFKADDYISMNQLRDEAVSVANKLTTSSLSSSSSSSASTQSNSNHTEFDINADIEDDEDDEEKNNGELINVDFEMHMGKRTSADSSSSSSSSTLEKGVPRSATISQTTSGVTFMRFYVRTLGWVNIEESDLTPERSSKAVNKCINDLSRGVKDFNDVVARWGEVNEKACC